VRLRRPHLLVAGGLAAAVALLALLGAVPSRAPDDGAGVASGAGPLVAGDSGAAPGVPCTGVRLAPGDDLRRAVDDHPPGTTFCLLAGVHHPAGVVPKDGQRFVGEGQDTILSGARPLPAAEARRDGAGRWYWSGQTQRSGLHGTLVGTDGGVRANPGDRYNEELFTSVSADPQAAPKRWRRVLSLAELGPGRWFLDQAAGRIYLSDDPARLGTIETSVAPSAIIAPSAARRSRVLIANLVVQRYASPAQEAAIGGQGALDWDFRYVTVRDNHGAGAELGPGSVMENCSIQRMGQIGLLGGGDAGDRPTVLRDTEVTGNKALSFDPDWEAGGAKFTRVFGQGMVVENNWFHDNPGSGLWFDIDNWNVVVRSNRFERNRYWGLLYEVSRQARIYWNQVLGTSRGPEGFPLNGAGIVVFNSAGVEVTQNLLAGNANGVLLREDRRVTRFAQDTYRQGIPHLQRVVVSDNDVATAAGGVTGMQVRNGDAPAGWWQRSNARFSGNTYRSAPGGPRFLGPGNNHYSYDQWRALGNDPGSPLRPASSPGSLPRQATAFVASRYGALAGGD
jgi:Right handed beta helix region